METSSYAKFQNKIAGDSEWDSRLEFYGKLYKISSILKNDIIDANLVMVEKYKTRLNERWP